MCSNPGFITLWSWHFHCVDSYRVIYKFLSNMEIRTTSSQKYIAARANLTLHTESHLPWNVPCGIAASNLLGTCYVPWRFDINKKGIEYYFNIRESFFRQILMLPSASLCPLSSIKLISGELASELVQRASYLESEILLTQQFWRICAQYIKKITAELAVFSHSG